MRFIFHTFSFYDCHLFFEKLVDIKNDKVKFDILSKLNEENFSKTFGCNSSYGFLSIGLGHLVKNLENSDFNVLKKDSPDNWHHLNEELAYSNEYFNNINDSQKPVHKRNKEDFLVN